ncbi:hypothetical protein HUA74_20870 [Myxococcus sp. CA051A]|uniref:hypothetical protein n=1 Tax=unclassified Myxococcus TaxID=2648731 RepID=UPI00157B23CF|nr:MULTISPECIES: hypothetical protein [unclassified Myxococcus]NTX58020.1 hypothetical protein [Myxococcus sp. CA039A]NTX63106.1 hypothetical protein [Myxococcus sp. CA051A]
MKKFLLSTLGASALVLAACSGDDSVPFPGDDPGVETPVPGGEDPAPGGQDPGPVPGGENPGPTPGGGQGPGTPSTQSFELRVRGEGLADYTSLKVPVSDVLITTAEGKPVPVQVMSNMLELATPGHSPLAARFTVPPGVDKVKITVHFNALGDFARNGAQASELDARVAPVTFEARVRDLSVRGRAVLVLDMARSMVALQKSNSTLMLPNGSVKY